MNPSEHRNPIKYLSAILAVVVAALLAFVFAYVANDPDPWPRLLLQVIPSLIAALAAYAAVYFFLEAQGVSLTESAQQRSARIARECFKYQYGDHFCRPGKELDLTGQWKMRDWRHGHPEDREWAYSEDAYIYQDGSRVWGTYSTRQGIDEDGNPAPSPYAFHGDLEGDILTGRWWQTEEKAPWKGVFQFKVVPGNLGREVMEGQWVGFRYDKAKINSGIWEWARPDQPFPSERSGEIPAQ